jgi:DNA-binding Lrp family transcriptional regulator
MKRGKKVGLVEVLEDIKSGLSPAQISKKYDLPKQNISYFVGKLKKQGCIEKIGYGVWKYIKPYEKSKKTVVIGKNSGHSLKPNTIRGHGFLFKLDLPNNFRNWDKREDILKDLKIRFEDYFVGGIKRGQRITAQNTKVALTDKSIIINFPESYIAETPTLARKDAVAKFLRVVKHLERIMRANFSQFGKYKFRVSRQHYALIKNSLARQYLDDEYNKKKLHIYSGRGLWLLIDNSYNLEELEAVHKKTAVKDSTKVQNFFNGLDLVEGYTPQYVLSKLQEQEHVIGKSMKVLEGYAEQIALHLKVEQEQLKTQKMMQETLKKMDQKLSTHTK